MSVRLAILESESLAGSAIFLEVRAGAAVVCAVICCNSAARRTKWDRAAANEAICANSCHCAVAWLVAEACGRGLWQGLVAGACGRGLWQRLVACGEAAVWKSQICTPSTFFILSVNYLI